MSDPFAEEHYLLRRKVFKLLGGAFHIYEGPAMERVLFYAEQKAFKLKEDFTVFGDEGKTQPLLRIKARSIVDFSATYDIVDARNDERVGACRRKGLKSMLRDEWEVLGPDDEAIATCTEDSLALALLRRLVANLVPQSYEVHALDGTPLARFGQYFNPFVFKMDLDFSLDVDGALDRRLGVGLGICMMAIEGRQQ